MEMLCVLLRFVEIKTSEKKTGENILKTWRCARYGIYYIRRRNKSSFFFLKKKKEEDLDSVKARQGRNKKTTKDEMSRRKNVYDTRG